MTTEILKTEKAKRLKTRQNLADLRDTRKGTSRTPKRHRRESELPCQPGETPFGQGDHPRSVLLGAGCILWEIMASTCARDTGRHLPPPVYLRLAVVSEQPGFIKRVGKVSQGWFLKESV